MASPHGILVLAEPGEERLASISLELVGAGRRLADAAGEPLFAVLAGLDAQAQELLAAGVDRVSLLPAPDPTGTSWRPCCRRWSRSSGRRAPAPCCSATRRA